MGKLYRSRNRVIAGVCAGVADYFGFDVKITRVMAVVLLLFSGFGGVMYIALWLLMPEKRNSDDYAGRLKTKINDRKVQ